jgi:hypothetical protein
MVHLLASVTIPNCVRPCLQTTGRITPIVGVRLSLAVGEPEMRQGGSGDVRAALAPARAPTILGNLRGALGLLGAHPVICLSLGAGITLSLLSLCCGIGVVMAPWLACELLAVQLATQLGEPIERIRSWLSAGIVLLGAVVLVASVGWLTLLGLGTQPLGLIESGLGTRPPWTEMRSGGAWLSLASAVVALVFVLPFLYTPHILLRTRATLGACVLESARLVARTPLAHLVLSLAANAVQIGPVVVAAVVATWLQGSDSGPLFMVASLPLLSLSVPLGQAMIVHAYGERDHRLARLGRDRLAGRPPWSLVVLWSAIVAAPILAFGMVGASLARPSRVAEGSLPGDAVLLDVIVRVERPQRLAIEGTALELAIDARHATVRASDGGGAGRLPLRATDPIESVRVARRRDQIGIELTQAGLASTTFIDRAGVRLDDDLQTRLFDRVPEWAVISMLIGLLLTAACLLPVMGALGELRRQYSEQPGSRPTPRELLALRARTLQRATLVGGLLLPLGLTSLYWGVSSLLGL